MGKRLHLLTEDTEKCILQLHISKSTSRSIPTNILKLSAIIISPH